ncbi:MAG: anthranilate/aminodeoxychorismate synthase component II [Syntrophus sp. (in: bacteria)]|nr:anthranilate/aminodeoxychorismate synthase component II [Syntrophus sp. (in: bacteria)]
MIALIDNYDSFTFNIYDYLMKFADIRVFRNTDSLEDLKALDLQGLVISPGPSHPSSSLLSLDAITCFKGKIPILGICLGMQAIAYEGGSTVRRAKKIMHGKVDSMKHSGGLLFKGVEKIFTATRYHSLVVENDKNDFHISAVSESDGEIMAIENIDQKLFGLQFHPESYATDHGITFIENFVEVCNGNA